MRRKAHNLAIETSSSHGSVALGGPEGILACAAMPPRSRHAVDLLPTIDRLCREQGVTPADLGEIYVSAGPGSFTGLRISVTTAKTLAMALDVRLVAVPTLDVLARNAPRPDAPARRLAVRVNVKTGVAWSGFYHWEDSAWSRAGEPGPMSLAELLEAAGASPEAPLWILADPAPEAFPAALPAGVTLLPAELAVPRAEAVWELGRAAARAGRFVDALHCEPIYARRPEAEELWDKRLALAAAGANENPAVASPSAKPGPIA